MGEAISNGGEFLGEGSVADNGFNNLPKESFEDFRARIENEEKFDESRFDLTPLEPDVDGFAETAENNSANNQFTSPVNGSRLENTETPGIMRSDYDDILYHVSKDGEVVPLQSPINGSELVMTETPDIMKSEYDDILYHVSENGEITPLQSPINGNSLDIAGDGVFVDETTGQQFSLDDILNK